jgi:hypothetical protein
MNISLRKAARKEPDEFRFIIQRQKVDPRRGCSRVRELARLWHRVHQQELTTPSQGPPPGVVGRLARSKSHSQTNGS